MFENLSIYFVLAFLCLLFGFKNLEALKKNHGKPSPKVFFPAVLAIVGAIHFQHFRGYGTLEAMAWGAFAFLAFSPILGILLFHPKAIKVVVKMVASLAIWVASFWWISQTFEVPKHHTFAWSLIPLGMVLFPWNRAWQSWCRHRTERQRKQAELTKAERQQQQEAQKLAQEQESEALLRDLIRDLGK